MKKAAALLAYVLTVVSPVFGQTAQQFNVSGTAMKSVNPTEIVVNIAVEEEGQSAEGVFNSVQNTMQRITDYLKKHKAVKSFETSQLQMNITGSEKYKTLRMRCNQSTSIVISDIEAYDDLMMQLVKMGVNRVNDLQFRVENMAELKREVQLMAINQAKEKAAAFAEELGVKITGLLQFQEQNFYYGRANTANYMSVDAPGANGPSISPNQVEIMMSVQVSFSFENAQTDSGK